MFNKKEYDRLWKQNNPDKVKAQRKRHYLKNKNKKRTFRSSKEYQSTYYKTTRNKFLDMYGSKCSCCEETTNEFLTIEHKNGQRGMKKETSNKAYRNAINEYRPDLYEVLCYNCNCAKGKYGYCPHQNNSRGVK